jgi:hypothetical protein
VGSRALKFSIQKRSRPAETEIFEYIYEIAKKISQQHFEGNTTMSVVITS